MAGSMAGRMRLAQWFRGARTDPEEGEAADENRRFRRKRPLHIAVLAFLAVLFLYILVLVFGASSVARVGALSVALACASVGALLGFIFAIPKRTEVALIKAPEGSETESQGAAPAVRASLADSAYRPNTSLEEISD